MKQGQVNKNSSTTIYFIESQYLERILKGHLVHLKTFRKDKTKGLEGEKSWIQSYLSH
jgi:hypothetical protein